MMPKKSSRLMSLLTAGAMLLNPLHSKAEQISGTVDNVYITNQETLQGELLEGINVEAEGLGSDITDENGFYLISQNPVIEPGYDRPVLVNPSSPSLYDALGRRIAKLSNDNLEARISPVRLPSGKYFIKDNNNLFARPYGIVTLGGYNLPVFNFDEYIKKEKQKFDESFKSRKNRTSSIRRFTASKEGYHEFSRTYDIRDSSTYDFFMVPIDSAESEDYDTILDVYKSLCTGWNNQRPRQRDPRDLPLSIYNQNIPEPNDSVNYLEGLLASIEDAEHNGRNNWFNNEFLDALVDSGEVGVNIIYTNNIPGGGVGWTQIEEIYGEGHYVESPYRWTIYIRRNFRSQGSVNSTIRRELARVMGLASSSSDREYIMWSTGLLAHEFHPDELKTLDMHYSIIQRDYGFYFSPHMDWYH